LSHGVNFHDSQLALVGKKYAENRYYYNISNPLDFFSNKLPSELLLPKNVEASIYFNPESPLSIKNHEKSFALYYGNKYICKAELNPRPKFFDKTLSGQVQAQQIISMYGRYILAVFFSSYCFLFSQGKACQFCSLRTERTTPDNDNLASVDNQTLFRAIQIALKYERSRIKYIMFTTGTHHSDDISYLHQGLLLDTIQKILPKSIKSHTTIMPPKNFRLIQKLYKSGLNSIAFDLEVYDKDSFKYLCPGKEEYFGYENFIEAIKYGRKIFGHSNIKVGFVGGLEDIDSLRAGMDYFGKIGASIAINVFHPDINTPLKSRARPSEKFLLEMVKYQSQIYKKYKLRPVFPVGGRRSSLDTEAYRGFFD